MRALILLPASLALPSISFDADGGDSGDDDDSGDYEEGSGK